MLDESRHPLLIGATAPNCVLPTGAYLHDLRGKPVVLAFAPDNWNPAEAYQSEIFVRLLRDFDGTFFRFDTTTWHSLNWRGEVAAQFGVTGQRTLLLLDEQGILRWQTTVSANQGVNTGQILTALEEMRAAVAPPMSSEVSTVTNGVSRRTFLTATLATAALLVLVGEAEAAAPVSTLQTPAHMPTTPAADSLPITLTVNGQVHRLEVEPRVALLDALREKLQLTGTKKGCDHGQCGACTVHMDGQSVLSCLTLAVMSEGRQITTIEGLAKGEELHPMQTAFVKHDAFQCGYCTPGQIMAAAALMQDKQKRSTAEIKEAMSGNLCRCAAYPNIIAAIQETQTT